MYNNRLPNFGGLLTRRPQALANVTGSRAYPDIEGQVRFYGTSYGVLVVADVLGLPRGVGECDSPVFGFHIHEGDRCTGTEADPFANARTHYNPYACAHPYHAGDLPPLLGANGMAFAVCLSDRFTVEEIIGGTVIIHARPDDFTTQPSGNAGAMMACGVIK